MWTSVWPTKLLWTNVVPLPWGGGGAQEEGVDSSDISDNLYMTFIEFFIGHCYNPPPPWGAPNTQHDSTYVFHGDAIEIFFVVILSYDKDDLYVLNGIGKHILADVNYVITTMSPSNPTVF